MQVDLLCQLALAKPPLAQNDQTWHCSYLAARMFFEHRHDYTSREMPWPFDSDFGPDLNRSESRLAPARTEVRNGGRIITAARVFTQPGSESDIQAMSARCPVCAKADTARLYEYTLKVGAGRLANIVRSRLVTSWTL